MQNLPALDEEGLIVMLDEMPDARESDGDASVEPQPATPDPSDVSFKTRSGLAENEAAIEGTVNTEIQVQNAHGSGNRKKRKLSNEAMSDYGQAIYSPNPRRCSHDTTPSPTQHVDSSRQDEATSFDPNSKPVHFLREFDNINTQRQGVQQMQIQLREDRQAMKFARQKFFEAASKALKLPISEVNEQGEMPNGSNELENVAQTLQDLEEKEIAYDNLEGELIPAEYKLRELEEDLYEHMVKVPSPAPSSAPTEFDIDNRRHFLPSASEPTASIPQLKHYVATIPLSDLAFQAREVKAGLASLEAEHEDLIAESVRRDLVGAKLDDYDQSLLESYSRRRTQLWLELAALERRLLDNATVTGDTDATIASVGFQFNGIDTETFLDDLVEVKPGTFMFKDVPVESGRAVVGPLTLHEKHFESRKNVLTPSDVHFLEPTLNAIFPTTSVAGYPFDDNSWYDSVCNWLLKCAESSWFSLIRFFGDYVEHPSGPDYERMKNYLSTRRPTALFAPTLLLGEDLESLDSSRLPSVDKSHEPVTSEPPHS